MAFFSGQDTNTLKVEGNDTNCFVSLIVDTKGTYVAAITRKIKEKKEVTTYYYGKSYEFFGDGEVKIEPPYQAPDVKQKYIDTEAIEYFMLDVEREIVDNPLEYLDYRFNEIERKKEAIKPVIPQNIKTNTIDKDEDFFNWIHSSRKTSAEAKEALLPSAEKQKQPTLFSEEVMDELVDTSKWQPDPTIIHQLTVAMVTSSLIVDSHIDLKQWIVRHMVKKYDEIFLDFSEFETWADNMVDFIISHYNSSDLPSDLMDDWDALSAKIAKALIEELETYPINAYLDHYISLLNQRAYE